MKERPIIMQPESIRAILDGRKTETRRVIKPQPTWSTKWKLWGWKKLANLFGTPIGLAGHMRPLCPYGQPGQRLWVRETFCSLDDPLDGFLNSTEDGKWSRRVVYKQEMDAGGASLPDEFKWRSPATMPRWASRSTLELTGTGVEIQQEPDDEIPEAGLWVWVLRFREVT